MATSSVSPRGSGLALYPARDKSSRKLLEAGMCGDCGEPSKPARAMGLATSSVSPRGSSLALYLARDKSSRKLLEAGLRAAWCVLAGAQSAGERLAQTCLRAAVGPRHASPRQRDGEGGGRKKEARQGEKQYK